MTSRPPPNSQPAALSPTPALASTPLPSTPPHHFFMRSPQAVIDAAVPELPKLRRALIAAREDLILGFGAAPLAAAAGSFATTAGADFSPGRGADLLLLVQRVQRKRASLCRRSWATRSSTHTRTRAPRMRTHAHMMARVG